MPAVPPNAARYLTRVDWIKKFETFGGIQKVVGWAD
jgi:hypothetical protein